MDFTRLLIITGMTIEELKSIPRIALENIIDAMNNRLLNAWHPASKRQEIEYQIKCYEELMITAR